MITTVLLPQLELTMDSVTVANVLVEEGAQVTAEQTLIEVETQKAMSEVPAPVGGFVRGLAVKSGDIIGQKTLICYISTIADEPLTGSPVAKVPATVSAEAAALVPAEKAAAPAGSTAIRAVPATRKLARDLGVDLAEVKPSGPEGRITPQDVEAHAAARRKAGAPVETAAGGDGWEPLPAARLALNAQMQKSLAEIPQIVISRQLDVTQLSRKEEGVTFTHKLIARLGAALAQHPALRTATDGKRTKVMPVSVAVAIDSPAGLVAPVLREADLGSLATIAAKLAEYRGRAEQRALQNEELKDGPFALTNLGMLGVDFFSPFVFFGQTAVLAVGRITDAPDGGRRVWVSLAVDHRVVDGAEAARFLETLQKVVA